MEKLKIRAFRKKLRQFDRLNELFNNSCCVGVTMAQCHTLLEIEDLGETTTIQLANNLLLDKSTLSRTINGLVKRGLIERKENSTDRRYVRIILSEKGKNLCDELNERNDNTYSKMLSHLSQYEIDSLMMNFELFVKVLNDFIQGKNNKNKCCS